MADPSKINRPLTRDNVRKAHELIKPYIHLTPVLQCDTLSAMASTPQHLRMQPSTSADSQEPHTNGTVSNQLPSNGTSHDPVSFPTASTDGHTHTDHQDALRPSQPKSANPQINIFLKLESHQKIGAFKTRGAFHALSRLTPGELSNGVITHSSGNHAQALALAARTRGIPAHIVMPTISTPSKIAGTKAQGARVYFSGSTEPERVRMVEQVQAETGALLVPPYDHPDIILGQGTVGLEFEEQVKALGVEEAEKVREHEGYGWRTPRRRFGDGKSEGLDTVVAPIGGGGLLSGIATALEGTGVAVFGAEPSFGGADDCARGLAENPPRRIEKVSTLTIADGLRTPVGKYPWTVVSDKEKVRGVYSVTEDEIKSAMRLLFERAKVVAEPSGAVALAVVLYNEEFRRAVEREAGGDGWNVGVVVSGGNTTMEAIVGLFAEETTEKIGSMDGQREDTVKREEGKLGRDGSAVAENVAG
ncbi:MAG: hypothetical protein M1828_007660 [Chrysothrix sp. TS-e1954]|nr:MAG: hypothetical protein M1828_007660 [Chrysothrix sp. TS-e1954]